MQYTTGSNCHYRVFKPENYVRTLTEQEYKIKHYKFQHVNLGDKGSTRGIALYVHESINSENIDTKQIIAENQIAPREMVSVKLHLTNNEKFLLTNMYRNPSY